MKDNAIVVLSLAALVVVVGGGLWYYYHYDNKQSSTSGSKRTYDRGERLRASGLHTNVADNNNNNNDPLIGPFNCLSDSSNGRWNCSGTHICDVPLNMQSSPTIQANYMYGKRIMYKNMTVSDANTFVQSVNQEMKSKGIAIVLFWNITNYDTATTNSCLTTAESSDGYSNNPDWEARYTVYQTCAHSGNNVPTYSNVVSRVPVYATVVSNTTTKNTNQQVRSYKSRKGAANTQFQNVCIHPDGTTTITAQSRCPPNTTQLLLKNSNPPNTTQLLLKHRK